MSALNEALNALAISFDKEEETPKAEYYALLVEHPDYAFDIIARLNDMAEATEQHNEPLYAACLFALDVCVAQLQAGAEANNKVYSKALDKLMNYLATVLNTNTHSLSYWLPVMNGFYEVDVTLTQGLQDAYFNLAMRDTSLVDADHSTQLDSIRELVHEMSDLSIYEIAENFFAQSYAMPSEFFDDLVRDLCSLPESQDIAILTLLHPKAEVREIAVATLDEVMQDLTLSSASLTRLDIVRHWFDEANQAVLLRWIKAQRRKGVVFLPEATAPQLIIHATEVDGSGSQGIFIQIKKNRKSSLCSILVKANAGIKDAWITLPLTATEVKQYFQKAFDDNVTLRTVDVSYLVLMLGHFLAETIAHGGIPSGHFLEIYELLGLRIKPKLVDINTLIEELSVQIVPFTPETLTDSLRRSKSWVKSKKFTESWYVESPEIDKIVNHNSSFVSGVKVCDLEKAMEEVFVSDLEQDRDRWQFHFLWVALWVKSCAKKNEKVWQDSFLIAYAIHQRYPLQAIPVMQEICHQSVINSVETMQERRTHLSQE